MDRRKVLKAQIITRILTAEIAVKGFSLFTKTDERETTLDEAINLAEDILTAAEIPYLDAKSDD